MSAATFELRYADLLERRFYFLMMILIALVVVGGFGRSVDAGLIHPAFVVPPILYIHTALYVSWMIFLLVQTGLVQTGRVKLHRLLGMSSLGVGVLMPIVGVLVALKLAHIKALLGNVVPIHLLLTPLTDMLYFSVFFALGVGFRRKPEFHRRLMLLATIVLTDAAFSRWPHFIVPNGWYYGGLDALILLCIARDFAVQQRIHMVYLAALPTLLAGQALTLLASRTEWWFALASKLVA